MNQINLDIKRAFIHSTKYSIFELAFNMMGSSDDELTPRQSY